MKPAKWLRKPLTYTECIGTLSISTVSHRLSPQIAEVPIPMEYLWNVVMDIPATPNFLPRTLSVERMPGGAEEKNEQSSIAVGTRFRATVECGKSKVTMHQTVTRLETTDPVERYLSEGISFQTPEGTTLNVTNTSTLTVQQTDMLSSRLLFAVALDLPVGGSLQDFVLYYLCAPCLHR